MSLVGFHKVLITTAILFCGAFAAWQFDVYGTRGGWMRLVLSGAFALGAVFLVVYLMYLDRFLDGQERGRGEG